MLVSATVDSDACRRRRRRFDAGNSPGDPAGNDIGKYTGKRPGNDIRKCAGNLTGKCSGKRAGKYTRKHAGNDTGNLAGQCPGDPAGDHAGNDTGNGTGKHTGDNTGKYAGLFLRQRRRGRRCFDGRRRREQCRRDGGRRGR